MSKKDKKPKKKVRKEKTPEPWWKNVSIGVLAHPSNIYNKYNR